VGGGEVGDGFDYENYALARWARYLEEKDSTMQG
jgi:hypothetical protein